jgi:hypothetical protein
MHPRLLCAPIAGALVILTLTAPQSLHAQGASLPLKYAGPPTKPELTAADLMTRLYIFADDSMAGRYIGTDGNNKATAYIEREVRRLGLKPAGDSGGYFQYLPTFRRALDPASTITVNGRVFKAGVDFVATTVGPPRQITNVPTIYGGALLDTLDLLSNDAVRGKVVLVRPFNPAPGTTGLALQSTAGFERYRRSMAGAILVTISGDTLNSLAVRNTMAPTAIRWRSGTPEPETLITLTITTRVAEALLGIPLAQTEKSRTGNPLTTDVRFRDVPTGVRNVVAVLPGSDRDLAGQFVAIGAHSDHIGTTGTAVDHDSVRAFNRILRPEGADSPFPARVRTEDSARVRVVTDSLHAAHGGARRDSIYNGADDDGSGSMSVLEIAEAFAKGPVKPKRSLLFAWHAGEELGMWGSEYFTDHPTVPRDSIVAQLNMDMVGRGGDLDVTGSTKGGTRLTGRSGYVQLIGSRRLSTELGDLVEAVNTEQQLGLVFDYSQDAEGHPQQIYCRSDHAEYARFGIPIVFITTGGHLDYHQVTDEPQYIDYGRMEQVAKLVFESVLRVAGLDHRIVVDKPKPDPGAECRQ